MNEQSDLRPKTEDIQSGWTTDLSPPARARQVIPPRSGVLPALPPTSSRSRLVDRMLEDNDPRIIESAFDGYPTK